MTNLVDSLHDSTTPQDDDESFTLRSVDSSPNVAALLLTNVATIASNELNHSVLVKPVLFDPAQMTSECGIVPGEMTCACLHYDYGRTTPTPMVSSDDENSILQACDSPTPIATCCPPPIVESSSSPLAKRQKTTNPGGGSDEFIVQNPNVVRKVISKKFSWKHYPELEEYLIAHRQEYLRHSRLNNYSRQQKKFNNRLTENLLELATSHGYIFQNFTFTQLRDKIRCYYKSYLQTLRKQQQRQQQEED